MPQAKAQAATDTTGNAQGRFTVQLPADVREPLAELGREAIAGVKRDMDIEIELSMAQIVTGIIKAQHKALLDKRAKAAQAEAEAKGDGSGEAS